MSETTGNPRYYIPPYIYSYNAETVDIPPTTESPNDVEFSFVDSNDATRLIAAIEIVVVMVAAASIY